MSIQTIFYFISVINAVLWIFFLIFGIAILWKIYSEIRNTPKRIEEKISNLLETKLAGFITTIGIPIATAIFRKIKERKTNSEKE